jgi:hypothetical protein
MSLHPLLQKLTGTDRRSTGRSDEVAAAILAQPELFGVIFDGILSADPVLRMRCADAVEKASAQNPALLKPHKAQLIGPIAQIDQQEVRWHAAQMFARVTLTPKERKRVMAILETYLNDKSAIVKAFSMQAMADLAMQDDSLRPMVLAKIKALMQNGTPAVQSRGRKLLLKLGGK